MILGDVFERFAQDSPLSVMAQGVLESALNPRVVDQLFEDVAERQYTRKLLFSSIVDLMSVVVCRIRPAICAAYQARAEVIEASLKAVYDKLDRQDHKITRSQDHRLIGNSVIHNPRSTIRDPRSAIHNLQSAICNLQSAIRNPQSAIRNPQSAICDPRSAIRDPQSAICNPQSAICNLRSAR